MKNEEVKTKSGIIRLLVCLSAFCILHSALADDLTALTDTNGNFTWPPTINAAQISGWTNRSIIMVSTNGGSGTIGTDGHFRFVDTNGMVVAFAPRTFTAMETNGNGFTYSNGMFYLNGETFFQSVITVANSTSNQLASVTNLQNAVNNLSNQMFALFSASNAVTFAALAATNTAIRAALVATNTSLLAAIATNGVESTNLAYALAYANTNFTLYSVSNATLQLTNFAYLIGQNATNYANLLALYGTNNANFVITNAGSGAAYFSQHFRQGTGYVGAGTNLQPITFDPAFADGSYRVYLSSTGIYPTNQFFVFGSYSTYFLLQRIGGDTNYTYTFDYLLYHP